MFRNYNQIEKKIIENLLIKISSNFSSNFDEIEKYIYIFIKDQTQHDRFPKIYLLTEELKNIISKIKYFRNISSGGLYFGFIKKGKFFLSLEGAEFLHKRGFISELLQLFVNKHGEKSILYGNNISKKMLLLKTYNFKERDFMLVFNEEYELIAIGRSAVDGDKIRNLEPNVLVAINLSDKGRYLREKQ